MKHVKIVSKAPAPATDIPVSTKIQFIVAILTAFTPILVAKDPNAT
jgi:hypothetical protein